MGVKCRSDGTHARATGYCHSRPIAGTLIEYEYSAEISGKAAAVGGRMLDGATKVLINQFFQRLVAEMTGGAAPEGPAKQSWWRRLLNALGFGT